MSEEKAWSEESSTRRFFLTSWLTVTTLAAVGGTIYPLVRYLSPSSKAGGGKKSSINIPLADVSIGDSRFFKFKGKPAILIRQSDKEVVALSAVCTHLGCIIKYTPTDQLLKCPCHGAKFDSNGKVLGGPAPSPLQAFTATIDGNQIIVEEA